MHLNRNNVQRLPSSEAFILFDGVCNLCNWFVQAVIRNDHRGLFRFGVLQSDKAREILATHGLKYPGLTTVVLVEGLNITAESDAVLRIALKLGGAWSLLSVLKVVPKVVRDGAYRFVSRHRYCIFGERDSCMVPKREVLERFI